MPWLLAQLAFFVWHRMTETDPREAYAVTVRLFMHAAIWMALLGLVIQRVGPQLLWAGLLAGVVTVKTELFNLMHRLIVEGWLGLPHRPQDGVVIMAVFVLLASAIKAVRQKGRVSLAQRFTTAQLAILMAFWTFLHVVLIGYTWPAIDGRRAQAYETAMLIEDKSLFLDLCAGQAHRAPDDYRAKEPWLAWSCAWFEASAPVPKQFVVFGGVQDIHEAAQDRAMTLYTWQSNYVDRSTIDSPLKHLTYFNDGVAAKILVDPNAYGDTKQIIMGTMHYFQIAFVIVWMYGGLCLLLLHEQWFRRRQFKPEPGRAD